MNLSSGARLGFYEIIAPLGSGGMGEVYRARDTRLDREVAIKVLPAALAGDSHLRERFEREARAISSLQHPHICALYDVGDAPIPSPSGTGADVTRFLVLELLEGETLAARLSRSGAIPFREAMRLAVEICDALATAHRSGIVHRDLKPANVFLVRGRAGLNQPSAKLLDFGLAKTAAPVVAASGASMLPTTPPTLTAQGALLGTFQYMAPEQIEGIEADPRTDIFAFGALLFEMLTGRPAFEGKSRATLLGSILKDQPPAPSMLVASVPKSVDRLVATCLEKDPEERWQSTRDLLRELQWIGSAPGDAAHAGPAAASRAVGPRQWAMVAAIAVVSLAVGFAIATWRRPTAAADAIRFQVSPPENTTLATPPGGGTGLATQAAISPDGKFIVFVASSADGYRLWLRPMGAMEARVMPGTDGGTFPFWSPDSRWVAFFAGGKLKKVSIAGGPPQVLCDAPSGRGGTWNGDNVIVFTPSTAGVLQRVSSAGGIPAPASVLDTEYGETNHRFPAFLPDGRHFLYTGVTGTCCPPSKPGRVKIGVLGAMEGTPLMQAESMAAYASGHVLFNREGTLMAQPFDASARTLSGDAFPVAEALSSEGSRYASFSVSDTGVLVYARGASRRITRLTWFDRAGTRLATVGAPATHSGVVLSSDERRVAVSIAGGAPVNRDIWLIDTTTGVPTRMTFDENDDMSPIWSPDGQRVAFAGNRAGMPLLLQKAASGTGPEEVLIKLESPAPLTPSDWSRDGRYILYTRGQGVAGSNDIWILPLFGERKASTIVATNASENDARFSPDGKWIAYSSTESGQPEVYVQPFPPTGAKFQVSQSGGSRPLWRSDGKELFFLSVPSDMRLMAASVETTEGFRVAVPVPLFPVVSTPGSDAGPQYAVSRDGKRFLVNTLMQQTTAMPLTVVVNWLSAVAQ